MKNRKWKNICSLAAVLATGVVSADQAAGNRGTPQKSKDMPMNQMDRGHEVSADQMGAGYNQSAAISLSGEWDWFLQASFIYWHASQENMSLGFTTQTTGGQEQNPFPGHMVYQDFKYRPGFKVATGFDTKFDDWSFFAEYTWYHHNTHTTKSEDSGLGIDIGNLTPNNNDVMSKISSEWELKVDILDVAVSRPYYQGTRLTVNPVVGLRAMWIHQEWEQDVTPLNLTAGPSPTTKGDLELESKSWGLGPRFGFYSNWHLGGGFSVIGNAFASVLYTRYTHLTQTQDQLDAGKTPVRVTNGTHGYLRPQIETNLGLGWGQYIYGHDYHIGFAATYDFNVFFNENMLRSFADGTVASTGSMSTPGNLYLHGLTLTGRFDF